LAALLALSLLVSCSQPAAPAAPEQTGARPTVDEVSAAVSDEMIARLPAPQNVFVDHSVIVSGLSCGEADVDCFQCDYEVIAHRRWRAPDGGEPAELEWTGRRASRLCRAEHGWTSTPLNQAGPQSVEEAQ
jgi:hypothetical protein